MMKLKEIRLKNFRCYEDLTVPLHEKLTVLVAPNGQGKTAVLDAISIALWDFVKKFDLARPYAAYNIGIHKDDIRIIKDKIPYYKDIEEIARYRQHGGMIRQLNTEIIATDSQGFCWKRYRDSEQSGSRTKEDKYAKKMQQYAQNLQHDIRNIRSSFAKLPLFAYYGTGRLWNEKRLTKGKQNKNDKFIRTFAYQSSLEPASNYKQFKDWFIEKSKSLTEELIALWEKELIALWENDQYSSPLLEELKSAVSNIQNPINLTLQIVGWENPQYSSQFGGIVLSHKTYGTLKLDQLSDGIQNVFGMVSDIAYRCYLLNSHLGKDAVKETEGIVLIDEVDMHLHPEWQQVILRDLQAAFPNLQFIVTTHSPQVLSTVKKEHIRIIRDGQLEEVLSNTYGEVSSDVMYRVQGVNPRPPITERNELERLTILVESGQYDSEDVKMLLVQLTEKLGQENEAISRIRRSIQCQTMFEILKQKAQ